MNITTYSQIREETRIVNRALARTNVCVEALKMKMGMEPLDKAKLQNMYGKDLILVLQNYLIQKYHKKYNLYTEESYKDERLFFYMYSNGECKGVAGTFDMNKGKHYLSEYVKRNGDILSSIISYGNYGFEEIEKQIIQNCSKVSNIKENENSDTTLLLYQLVTAGNCLGYFDMILISDELLSNEQFMMEEIKKEKFLISYKGRIFYIHKFTGQLMLSWDNVIDFKEWCNSDVGTGLKFILNLY